MPLGLILNELITNSIKYAFPNNLDGNIGIGLHLKRDDEYMLKVGDNGVGFPKNLDFRNTESLGLQLVNSLINQLNGTIELDRRRGTTFTIKFREQK